MYRYIDSASDASRRYLLGSDTTGAEFREPVGANALGLVVQRIGAANQVYNLTVVQHGRDVWAEALQTGVAPEGVEAVTWAECRAAIAELVSAMPDGDE